jgi:hypothetical protein
MSHRLFEGRGFELIYLAEETRLRLVLDAEQIKHLFLQLVQLIDHLLIGLLTFARLLAIPEAVNYAERQPMVTPPEGGEVGVEVFLKL